MIVTKEREQEVHRYKKRAVALYRELKSVRKTSEALSLEGIKRSGSWVALVLKEMGVE